MFSNGGLELNNVIIANGFAGNGGGIFTAGGAPFSATDTLFISNIAQGQAAPINGGCGGGVYLDFNMVTTLNRVSFIQNAATSVSLIGAKGGGMYNNGAADPLTNLQFDGNTSSATSEPADGGAIHNDRTMRVFHATITNNAATGAGAP